MHKQGGFRSLTRLPFLVSLSLDGVPCVLPPSARVRAGFDFPSVSASLRDRAIPRLRKIDIGRMHCVGTVYYCYSARARCFAVRHPHPDPTREIQETDAHLLVTIFRF